MRKKSLHNLPNPSKSIESKSELEVADKQSEDNAYDSFEAEWDKMIKEAEADVKAQIAAERPGQSK